jgi:hypothetical protein
MYNKNAAADLIALLIRHGGELDNHLQEVEPLCSTEEFQNQKRLVGKLLGSIVLDGLNVLVDEFPDLKPPELR